MPLGVRIFLVYFLFVGLAGWFVLSTVMDEIRPGVRQSTEETLVDTANLLAEILRDEVKAGSLQQSRLPALLRKPRSTTASMSPMSRAGCCSTRPAQPWGRTIRAGTMCC